ncbi:MAG TPA: PepSY domain-containing protein [Streptosporangiaceae bacterium]
MRKPLFVAMTASATLLVGGGVAVAMAGQPTNATKAAATRVDAPAASTSIAGSRITPAQARAVALRRTGGGQVASTELEDEHGRLVWKVDVRKGAARWRVDVDAATGLVVRARSDQSARRAAGSGAAHVDDRRASGADDGARAVRDGRGADDSLAHDAADDHGRDDHGRDDHGRDGHGRDDSGRDDHGHDGGTDDHGHDEDHGGHGADG